MQSDNFVLLANYLLKSLHLSSREEMDKIKKQKKWQVVMQYFTNKACGTSDTFS